MVSPARDAIPHCALKVLPPRACTCPRRHRDATPAPPQVGRQSRRLTPALLWALRAPWCPAGLMGPDPQELVSKLLPQEPAGPSAQARSARAGPPAVRTAESGGKSPSQQRPGRPTCRTLRQASESSRCSYQMDAHSRGAEMLDERVLVVEPGQAFLRRPHQLVPTPLDLGRGFFL